MPELTSKERAALGRNIRKGKDKYFSGRGGCGRLAAELGVTPQVLSHWMAGRRVPEPAQMAALAKVFNTSILKLCSLPGIRKVKGPPSTYDVMTDLLRKYKKAKATPGGGRKPDRATRAITAYVEKELGELPP